MPFSWADLPDSEWCLQIQQHSTTGAGEGTSQQEDQWDDPEQFAHITRLYSLTSSLATMLCNKIPVGLSAVSKSLCTVQFPSRMDLAPAILLVSLFFPFPSLLLGKHK